MKARSKQKATLPLRIKPRLGAFLKGLRTAKALSLAELAEKSGLRVSHLSSLENNGGDLAKLSIVVADRLAFGLGISMDELLLGDVRPARAKKS